MARGKKTGGRTKGVPNKTTLETKQWLQQLIDNNKDQFEKDLKKLAAKDRLSIIEKLMQYVIPKQQAISMDAQIEAEYESLEKLLEKCPDEALDKIIERMNRLKEDGEG